MIGQHFQRIREALDLNRAALARRLDISPSYVSRIERGLRTPSLEVLQALQREARKCGLECDVADNLLHADPVVLALNDLLNDPNVTMARKRAVRRLVLVLVRST